MYDHTFLIRERVSANPFQSFVKSASKIAAVDLYFARLQCNLINTFIIHNRSIKLNSYAC
jgi:hypothetical protein